MTSALEDIKSIDLDQWLTLATAPSPTKLQSGQTPYAYNTWVDEKPGSVITANGYLKVGTIPSGNPGTFSINYFNTSSGTQTYVVSDNATVWTTVDFQTFIPIITGLSSSFQLRGAVIRDKLWLTNGNDFIRVFDGSIVTILNGSALPSLTIQGMSFAAQNNSYGNGAITIAFTPGAIAGSEVVGILNTTQIYVQIQSGVSTTIQVQTAINNSPSASALVAVGVISGTVVTMPVTPLVGGIPLAPKGAYIAYHDERVWLFQQPSARSLCSFSALSDAAANEIDPDDPAAWPNDNSLQISEGDADYGTGLLLYRGYLHFFKQYSIWRLVGYDEYSYTRVKTRASTGTRFNESLQVMDSLVHFIGIDGIYVFDGEETDRISDIIDPSTAEQASFGFNQLQQPNQSSLFWETTDTADFETGFIPNNLAIANSATLQPADNTEADFQAGPTQTQIDLITNPNSVQLALQPTGGASTLVSTGKALTITGDSNRIGLVSYITDGNFSLYVGHQPLGQNTSVDWQIDLGTPMAIGQAQVFGLTFPTVSPSSNPFVNAPTIEGSNDGVNWTVCGTFGISVAGPTNYTINFPTATFRYWRLHAVVSITIQLTEIQIFQAGYFATGQFVSRTLDLGDTPASLGTFFSDFVLNGEGLTFQTQTSSNGSTWDSPVAASNGNPIGSVVRRYIRWIANFTSDSLNTAVISDVWLGTLYESAVHDTGGNIFAWGAFQSDYTLNGQSIQFYYRGAVASAAVPFAAWNLIVPGGALNLPVTDRYIQFKFEISGFAAGNNSPVVNSVTINWIIGSGSQSQVLQNVASFFWRNRYWLSAAGLGATANNTLLIRGKKTFQSPWQLKDWNILSFTRYLDNFYGTSSIDGSIFQLDTGFSRDGAPINSIFETGDFSFKGFQINVLEIMLEAQRLGPYTLFVGTSTDQGQTWVDHPIDLTLPVGGSPNFWKRINNLNLTTDKLRLRFFTNSADQPWQVHTCAVYYKMSAQRGTIGT